jgi:hypothetical protein
VEDDDTFDIEALHAAEDAEESEGHEGPLRVFLGAPGAEPDDVPLDTPRPAAPDTGPIWDVSALAMPEAPEGDLTADALDFLDEGQDISEDDVVDLGSTPPPLVMEVSLGDEQGLSATDWAADSPTVPAIPASSLAPSKPPPSHADPMDVPDRSPFPEDSPSRVETMVNAALGDAGLRESDWNEDEETFFGDAEPSERSVPDTPPQLRVQPEGGGRGFRPIPSRSDPPVIPILILLLGIVVVSLVWAVKFSGGEQSAELGTLENTVKARPPLKVRPTPPADSRTEAPVGDFGYLNIESDKDAIIYVGDRKVGTTPLKQVEVSPGNHRVLAMDVETGARKSVTTVVVRGQERRIVFQFR